MVASVTLTILVVSVRVDGWVTSPSVDELGDPDELDDEERSSTVVTRVESEMKIFVMHSIKL